jgi:predicted aspartyl protease
MIAMCVSVAANAECEITKYACLSLEVRDNQLLTSGSLNGHSMKFLIDTSAPGTLVSAPFAHAIGLRVDDQFAHQRLSSMEGRLPIGQAIVDEMQVDRYALKGIHLTVRSQHETFGHADAILGNDFLGQFDIEIDLKGNTLNLFKPQGCDQSNLAFWTDAYNVLDLTPTTKKVEMPVEVNGHSVVAELDSGSPFTGMVDTAARTAEVPDSDADNSIEPLKSGAADYFTLAYDVTNGFGLEHRSANSARSGLQIDGGGGPAKIWQATAQSVKLDQELVRPAKL